MDQLLEIGRRLPSPVLKVLRLHDSVELAAGFEDEELAILVLVDGVLWLGESGPLLREVLPLILRLFVLEENRLGEVEGIVEKRGVYDLLLALPHCQFLQNLVHQTQTARREVGQHISWSCWVPILRPSELIQEARHRQILSVVSSKISLGTWEVAPSRQPSYYQLFVYLV